MFCREIKITYDIRHRGVLTQHLSRMTPTPGSRSDAGISVHRLCVRVPKEDEWIRQPTSSY
jgi:hypothetical protein